MSSNVVRVHFWVHFRKIASLDDANSFLFNAYSVSPKKVYAIRAPDHPPEKALKRRSFKALLYVSVFSLYSNYAVQQFAGVFIRWFVDHIFCFPFLHYDSILHYHDPVADHAYKREIM